MKETRFDCIKLKKIPSEAQKRYNPGRQQVIMIGHQFGDALTDVAGVAGRKQLPFAQLIVAGHRFVQRIDHEQDALTGRVHLQQREEDGPLERLVRITAHALRSQRLHHKVIAHFLRVA